MSLDSAKGFIAKTQADEGLKLAFMNAASADEKMKIAKDAGFDFTADELKQAREQGGELSDSDLDSVAGGCSFCVHI